MSKSHPAIKASLRSFTSGQLRSKPEYLFRAAPSPFTLLSDLWYQALHVSL
jgi:hypothetical protein